MWQAKIHQAILEIHKKKSPHFSVHVAFASFARGKKLVLLSKVDNLGN